MAQRRRILGIVLGLVVIFLVLSTRRSSGSHPRDLRVLHDVEGKNGDSSRINEPPGKWDSVGDRFISQQGDSAATEELQDETPGEVVKQVDDLPEGSVQQRKTPKKTTPRPKQQKVLEDVHTNRVGLDSQKVGSVQENVGTGAAAETKAPEKEDKAKEKPAVRLYDAADDYRVILTHAPIIVPHQHPFNLTVQVFSKTGCPHCRDAKRILLNTHIISPTPFIVELDKHPHGPQLQAYVGAVTGRRTVPNIIVDRESIGGADEMRALEKQGKIAEAFLSRLPGRIIVDGRGVL